eukprot:EC825337.1.p1 GENE.EC825337.1~~EC825337.1.p1  ORF type:complete len:195 (+),score=75.10 EC825337.1:21-605(+)
MDYFNLVNKNFMFQKKNEINFDKSNDEEKKKPGVSTGTSIMAIQYKDGVILGADTRSSMGSYVANRFTDKIQKISDKVYCLTSGSSADTEAISDFCEFYLQMHSVEYGTYPLVKNAANLCKYYTYNYKDNLLAFLIIAGWDEKLGSQVYCLPLGGAMIKQPYAIGGSGSTYIYGYCDDNYKENMTKEECKTIYN